MISDAEHAYILARAYIPEHLPHYVTAISRTEPFLFSGFVAHMRDEQLIFIGYPLDEAHDEARLLDALARAKSRLKPRIVSIIAPSLPKELGESDPSSVDTYYRLDVTQTNIPQKTRNMLTRAQRELTTRDGTFGKEHKRLVEEFVRAHRLDEATRAIFARLPEYAQCAGVALIEARDTRGNLVAFDLADFSAAQYAFYMFNLRAAQHPCPGASDLLLARIIERARAVGKCYVNLGLGIDQGIAFFKRKWGATPFLSHCVCVQQPSRADAWLGLFDQLRR